MQLVLRCLCCRMQPVSDTGIAIAPEDHEAVFQEFRQVGTADKKAEGAGSTFTFTIPVRCEE